MVLFPYIPIFKNKRWYPEKDALSSSSYLSMMSFFSGRSSHIPIIRSSRQEHEAPELLSSCLQSNTYANLQQHVGPHATIQQDKDHKGESSKVCLSLINPYIMITLIRCIISPFFWTCKTSFFFCLFGMVLMNMTMFRGIFNWKLYALDVNKKQDIIQTSRGDIF